MNRLKKPSSENKDTWFFCIMTDRPKEQKKLNWMLFSAVYLYKEPRYLGFPLDGQTDRRTHIYNYRLAPLLKIKNITNV